MSLPKVKGTTQRNGLYYLQAVSPTHGVARKSLLTDIPIEATRIMGLLNPTISLFKDGVISKEDVYQQIESLTNSALTEEAPVITTHETPVSIPMVEEKTLSLGDAWDMCQNIKGTGNSKPLRGKKVTGAWSRDRSINVNRHMQVIFELFGRDKNIHSITEEDMLMVKDVISNMPKRRLAQYSGLSIGELIACDDVADEDKAGNSTLVQHFKTYSLFFKSFLTDEERILDRSPIERISIKESSVSYGKYTNGEMRRFVTHALVQERREWFKWIVLLLAHTGARTSEIATLTKAQVKKDEDSNGRYYLNIIKGKTVNAARQIPLHPNLIKWGFLDYVSRQEGLLFPLVATTNKNKIHKEFSDLRDSLNIAAKSEQGERRILHSFRHTIISKFYDEPNPHDWHIQQLVGHARSSKGETGTYVHKFSLNVISYLVDSLNWVEL